MSKGKGGFKEDPWAIFGWSPGWVVLTRTEVEGDSC